MRGSGNEVLYDLFRRIATQTLIAIALSDAAVADFVDEHVPMVEALERGDEDGAVAAFIDVVEATVERLTAQLGSDAAGAAAPRRASSPRRRPRTRARRGAARRSRPRRPRGDAYSAGWWLMPSRQGTNDEGRRRDAGHVHGVVHRAADQRQAGVAEALRRPPRTGAVAAPRRSAAGSMRSTLLQLQLQSVRPRRCAARRASRPSTTRSSAATSGWRTSSTRRHAAGDHWSGSWARPSGARP